MLRTTAENHTSDSIATLLLEVAHNALKSRYGVSTADLYFANIWNSSRGWALGKFWPIPQNAGGRAGAYELI